MNSTTPPCCLFFLVLYVLVYISHGASVQYVPNAACATPSGCDFNGPIWNITGVPTAGDDVIITSDVQTTIFANSASISLNSLWIGGNGPSAAITIVLTNCILNITESTNNIGLYWEDSALELYSSTVNSQHVHGATLFATNVTLNVVELTLAQANLTSCSSGTPAGNWTITNATTHWSSLMTAFLDFGNLYAYDCSFGASNRIAFLNSAQITNGYLSVNQILFVAPNSSVVLIDTMTNRITLNLEGPASAFTFLAPNSNASLTFGITASSECYPDSFIYLGDGVTATIVTDIFYLIVGEQVTINIVWLTLLWDLINLGTVPTTINVTNSLTLQSDIFANIELFGMLNIWGNVTINGTVSGPGSIWVEGNLICSNMSVREVRLIGADTFTVQSRLSANVLYAASNDPHAYWTINAPETYIWSPVPLPSDQFFGLDLLPHDVLFFNGNYEQTGGLVIITTRTFNATPPVLVNGSITLTNVTVFGDVDSNLTKQVLFRSLTKSILKNDVVFDDGRGGKYRLVVEDGDIYVELATSPARPTTPSFFKRNYIWLAIGGGAALVLLVAVVVVLVRRRSQRAQYTSLNS